MSYTEREFKEAVNKLAEVDRRSQLVKEELFHAKDEISKLKSKLCELNDHPIKRIRTFLGWQWDARMVNGLRELLNEIGYLDPCCKRTECPDCMGQGARPGQQPVEPKESKEPRRGRGKPNTNSEATKGQLS